MNILKIPPTYFLITLVLIPVLNYFPAVGVNVSRPYNWSGFILIVTGWLFISSAFMALRKYKTTHKYNRSTSVVTEGSFRYSRNPMYLGYILILLGVAICFGGWIGFMPILAYFLLLNFIFIPYEEKKMKSELGEAFTEYKRKVRRWF